jgi:DUF1009 family protein
LLSPDPGQLSRFLPADFSAAAPVVLIAGQGVYPRLLAQRMQAHGLDVRLIALGSETDPEVEELFPHGRRAHIRMGQLGRLLKVLRGWQARYAIMAGQVTPGRLFRDLRPDLKALQILTELPEKNAHTLFGAVVAAMESVGVTTLDARSFLDDQLVEMGDMLPCPFKLTPAEEVHALRVTRAMAREDIGQSAVTAKGTVLAVEDFNGTNALLQRVADYPVKRKIFTKVAKSGHDFRFDVPVLGVNSLPYLKAGGISQLLLEADRLILLEKDILLPELQKLKIGLRGVSQR